MLEGKQLFYVMNADQKNKETMRIREKRALKKLVTSENFLNIISLKNVSSISLHTFTRKKQERKRV